MFKSPTRITMFDEPEPLGGYTTATRVRLGAARNDLLARIDKMLVPEEDTRFEETSISDYPVLPERTRNTMVHDAPAVFVARWSDPDTSRFSVVDWFSSAPVDPVSSERQPRS